MKSLLTSTALLSLVLLPGFALAEPPAGGLPKHRPPMERMLEALPEKEAASFREAMKASREKDKPLREQSQKLRSELQALLTAKTFDKSAYLAKNKELGTLRETMHQHMSESFATAVSALSQDSRIKLADAMPEGHRPPPPPPGEAGHRSPPPLGEAGHRSPAPPEGGPEAD